MMPPKKKQRMEGELQLLLQSETASQRNLGERAKQKEVPGQGTLQITKEPQPETIEPLVEPQLSPEQEYDN